MQSNIKLHLCGRALIKSILCIFPPNMMIVWSEFIGASERILTSCVSLQRGYYKSDEEYLIQQ